MEMYKKLMAYYDSQELSKVQNEWKNLESHKYETGVFVDDLIRYWDEVDSLFELIEPNERNKINISNHQAPEMELFL